MDSTFMGTIVQVSLFITESSANLTILNISDYCLSLLEELGVASFLSFDTQEKFEREWTLLPINQIFNDNQKNMFIMLIKLFLIFMNLTKKNLNLF